MNRRRLMASTAAVALGPALGWRGWHVPHAGAQATPVASPAAVTTGPVVHGYAEIRADYAAARNAILTLGRSIVDQLMGSDPVAISAQLTPEMQPYVTEESLATLRPTLETNRVHFEVPQFGAVFDGHVDGQTIDGFFSQGAVTTFSLTADAGSATPTAAAAPTGRWTGQIVDGETPIDIIVTFQTSGASAPELTGTIDVPSQNMTGVPLERVSFLPSRPLGERTRELALPHSPASRLYIAQYGWGDAAITVSLGLAPDGANGQISGLMIAPEWPLPPDPAAEYVSPVTYHLPFEGVWWAWWGGETVLDNYHAEAPSQRHAYDLVIWKDGGTFRTDGARNEDYWVWGQSILAPAAGTIIDVRNDIPENQPGVLNPEPHPAGNHIVLQTAEREFVFLAHLQPGSISVQVGDQVAAGTPLALAGNSGNSSEAHLHIHIQDQADFYAPDAIGLPLRFADYTANGSPIKSGTPMRGELIARQ